MRLDEINSTETMPTRVYPFTLALATKYGGVYDWHAPRIWSRSVGGKLRDPEHWVRFRTKELLDAAWADLQSKGKMLYIKDIHYPEPAKPFVKLGKFVIGRAKDSLYIQTVSIMRNYLRKQEASPVKEEQINELSDKSLKKYVKKATKSADALQYYSDSRTDPDWEKAQKRKRMVDVAKGKLGKDKQ